MSAWSAAGLSPLWESAVAHKPDEALEAPRLWRWAEVRPLLDQAIRTVSPDKVERRALTLRNARPGRPHVETTTPGLNAAFQILLPGETARPHRHTIDALRFVIEGAGAVTKVDGKDCKMEPGDLVLTPGMTWHEHVHAGSQPVIWLDILNGPLHRFLGTARFEAGPTNHLPPMVDDAAFSLATVAPVLDGPQPAYSPVFRYPYESASAALAVAPHSARGDRRVRYTNPIGGGAAIPLIDAQLVDIEMDTQTKAWCSNANSICFVVEGSGRSTIGQHEIAWTAKDVFTIPAGLRVTHAAGRSPVRLFEASDREVLRRLGLYEESFLEA
jgi:gentisate 1,2-dioxygenase